MKLSANKAGFEERLIAFEDHAFFYLTVFIKVQPCAVCAFTALETVEEHPFTLFVSDHCLHF
jgi:hypothetical protein